VQFSTAIIEQPPAGVTLRSNWSPSKNARAHITKADSIIYRSSKFDCADFQMKARWCQSTPIRKIARSIHEPARDVARAVARTRLYKQSRKDRKKMEMRFAHLKRIMKLDRLRLRLRSVQPRSECPKAATQQMRVTIANYELQRTMREM
jgi:hypothetical protein